VNTWKVILATLAIFGAGVVTGGLLVSYSDKAHSSQRQPAETQPGVFAGGTNASVSRDKLPSHMPAPLRKDFVDRLDKELKLKPDQREHIEKIIGNGKEQAKRIWMRIEPEMNSVLMEARDKIGCELSTEQKVQFEEMLKQKARKNDKGTNAPASSGSTNSAALDTDAMLCLFGIRTECLNSNSPATSHSILHLDPKAPLRQRSEPGS
jgi:hypothetical protein